MTDAWSRRSMIAGAGLAAGLLASPVVRAANREEAMSEDQEAAESKSKRIGIVLFDDFETLDVFGPVQMWGRLPDHRLAFVTAQGGPVRSAQGGRVLADHAFADAPQFDVLMVPGGIGTRKLAEDGAIRDFIRRQDLGTRWTASVCTGAVLLAWAGVLDGRRATTNKLAFDWVAGQADKVAWQRRSRWVIDGKYATSSGVSAGTDMALALVEQLYDRAIAEQAAKIAEYRWHDDPADDPFAQAGA